MSRMRSRRRPTSHWQGGSDGPQRLVRPGAGLVAAAGISVSIPGLGPVVAGGLWALLGASAGAAVAATATSGYSQAWQDTFAAVKEGNFVVGVHSGDESEIERARDTMEAQNPLTINRFDDQ